MGSLLPFLFERRQRLDGTCLPLSAIFMVQKGTGQCLAGGLGMSPLGFMAITALTVPEIQVYSAITSETQGQQSSCVLLTPERQRGHGQSWTPSRFPWQWHNEAHCDIRRWHMGWERFPISLSGRLPWGALLGGKKTLRMANIQRLFEPVSLRGRIKDGNSTQFINFERLFSWCAAQ